MDLYLIVVRTTSSRQPVGSEWSEEVKYCGYDRDEARVVFHAESVKDYDWGFGGSARHAMCRVASDAETDDFRDDKVLPGSYSWVTKKGVSDETG